MAGLRLDLKRIDKDLTVQLASEAEANSNQQYQQDMDPLSDNYSPDDLMSPVEKLDKYYQSEEATLREIAVRSIADSAYFVDNYLDYESILDIVCSMASDHEPMLRVGILGSVSVLLERNTQFRENIDIDTPFEQENENRLYEIPVKMLNDFNQQVRRMSHNTLVLLLEEPKGSIDSLISQLCPMIKRCLGREENYDLRMDTVMLISRVAPLLGQEICISEFVPLLPSLASDTMFHVRKSFAICCKDLCSAVGQICTEESILPYFLQLCKDEVWGVRKACADVFMDVSLGCSLLSRQERLTPVFLHLLKDDSRWVRKAAYQCLGPFISTFYTPSLNNSSQINDSIEPFSDSELLDSSLLGETENTSNSTLVATTTAGDTPPDTSTGSSSEETTPTKRRTSPSHAVSPLMIFATPPRHASLLPCPDESSGEYSSFQFWRSPISALGLNELTLPSLDGNEDDAVGDERGVAMHKVGVGLSLDLFGGGAVEDELTSSPNGDLDDDEATDGLTDIKDELLAESEGEEGGDSVFKNSDDLNFNQLKLVQSPMGATPNGYPKVRVFIQNTSGQIHEEGEEIMSSGGRGHQVTQSTPFNGLDTTVKSVVAMEMTLMENTEPFFTSGTDQELVPDELIEMYLSMIDPVKAQSVDADLPLYCAFSFPAVLQTLGASHWPLLKPTFDSLSGDVQWKIRRILAHSLHEIARILGREKTVADLLTVVDEYSTKDLDDIKTGVLLHLADFFEILPSKVREEYFPSVLSGLLDTENEKNWRYRDSLAEQLIHLCDLFDCSFVEQHIVPVAIKLGHDKVAQIRETVSQLIAVLLQKFNHSRPSSCLTILREISSSFASSDRWLLRLMYVKQCELFLQKKWISNSLFAAECLPSLITLSSDVVPNIRLAVGRLLHSTLSHIDFFSSNSTLSIEISSTISALRNDEDRDVRFFSGAPPLDPPSHRPSQPADAVLPLKRRVHSLSEGETTNSSSENKFDIAKAASLLNLS